jgi:hypothetical protein
MSHVACACHEAALASNPGASATAAAYNPKRYDFWKKPLAPVHAQLNVGRLTAVLLTLTTIDGAM